jgi:hypothetical protein
METATFPVAKYMGELLLVPVFAVVSTGMRDLKKIT